MAKLRATTPYLVFLVAWFGLSYLYNEVFGRPAGVPRLYGEHLIWYDLGKRVIFLLFTYPVAIYVAKITGELRPGVLFGTLSLIHVAIWIYIMQLLDRMGVGEEAFFSIDGLLNYEYWPYTAVQFLTATVLPVLLLLLMNHLTNRSKRTRESTPIN